MSNIAIRVGNYILSTAAGLSKFYHIGRAQQRHDTLRDAIADARRKKEKGKRKKEDALRGRLPSFIFHFPSSLFLRRVRQQWPLTTVTEN